MTRAKKKIRTRAHIIHDLAVNHFERHALLCGYSTERIESSDYGIDMNLYTYSGSGEIENGCVYVQLKATDKPKYSTDGTFISFSIYKSDLEYWLEEPLPVILVIYDAQIDKAYWLHVQGHFQSIAGFNLETIGDTHTVRIRTDQVVNQEAIFKFASLRNDFLAKLPKRRG